MMKRRCRNTWSMVVAATTCLIADPTAVSASAPSWSQPPFLLEVDGIALDMAVAPGSHTKQWFVADEGGYAAPVFADVDGDGLADLVIGGFSGRIRWYRNVGSTKSPRFQGFDWLMSGSSVAMVQNFCCMAASPQLVDLDGDGRLDLTVGSYAPGAIHWFRGSGPGRFGERHLLTDYFGVPVFTELESIVTEPQKSFGAKPAWVDWDDDGRLDMIIGNDKGSLVVRLNKGAGGTTGITPIESQPMFAAAASGHGPEDGEAPILLNGRAALAPEKQTSPAVGDWDGDGLWDIVVGTESGSVYLLRNEGTIGEPKFGSKVTLLDEGKRRQWGDDVDFPTRGSAAQVFIFDINSDGKQDLIIGDFSIELTPRRDLKPSERAKFEELRRKLRTLDERVGFPTDKYDFRDAWTGYLSNPDLLKQAERLENDMFLYLRKSKPGLIGEAEYAFHHGRVWVYLQK